VNDAGKMLMLAGLGLFILGLVLWSGFGRSWLGRLPGDVQYHRGNFSFYFPFVTCIVVSIVLTVIFRLFRK
jgi:hypothetical protein